MSLGVRFRISDWSYRISILLENPGPEKQKNALDVLRGQNKFLLQWMIFK